MSTTQEEGQQGSEETGTNDAAEHTMDTSSMPGAEGPLATMTAELASVKRTLAEEKDRNLRLLAEFENFKRRSLKEQSELLKYQGEKDVVDMLEVMDNLELALAHSSAEYEKLKQGLEMIHKLFVERLGKWEIKGVSGVGQQFDPQKYAAISRMPAGGNAPGTILGELKKAYFYKDKLIRPGEVVVAADSE